MVTSGSRLAEWAELTGDRLPVAVDEEPEESEERGGRW